jgi:hypothetical protein
VQRLEANWLRGLQAYIAISLLAHLGWEILQLPLYTIWTTGTAREMAFAVLHCTGGDALIALTALTVALVFVGTEEWPAESHWRVILMAVALGIAYTIFSEWLNIVVRKSWAYSPLMPVVSILKMGLSPLLQWIVVPILALTCARTAAFGSSPSRL